MDTGSAARPRVLCVDDEPLVLMGLRRQLSRRFEVVTAASAKEALEVLSQGDEVAVVVSDLVMPDTDGVAFLKQAMAVSPDTSRILLTAYKDTLDLSVALDARLFFAVLAKPCASNELLDTVERAVALHRTRAGTQASGGSAP